MPSPPPIGDRIRQRRLMLQIRQADLARKIGISASYLNLIEHNRRRIGGKLLGDIAEALGVDYTSLAEGADQGLHAALLELGRGADFMADELEQIEALIARAPAWAKLLAQMQRRTAALEQTVDGLNDRLVHDPALATAMHEVLSMVSAVRSTASILASTPEIDPNWLGRFHKNLDQDSRRLARGAEAMVDYFDAQSQRASSYVTALEAQAALWDAMAHHVPLVEAEGAAAIAPLVAEVPETVPGTRALMRARLAIYAQDAAALPLAGFLAAAQAVNFDPAALIAQSQLPPAQVLRRLACLPPEAEAPEIGLVICDSAGAILHRKQIAGLSIPYLGAACPLWPLFESLSRPQQPVQALLEMPDGAQFQAWAVAVPQGAVGFGAPLVLQGTMLIMRAARSNAPQTARPVGSNCRVCPRVRCAARREPSMIAPTAPAPDSIL